MFPTWKQAPRTLTFQSNFNLLALFRSFAAEDAYLLYREDRVLKRPDPEPKRPVMKRPAKVVSRGRPMVAGVLVDSIDSRKVNRAKRDGADLVEVRVDTLKNREPPALLKGFQRIRAAGLGIILTIRSTEEGGRLPLNDAERLGLFSALVPHTDLVDIELGSKKILNRVVDVARRNRKGVIISYHNFRTTPGAARLRDIIKRCRAGGADLVKIAVTADKRKDIGSLARVLLDSSDLIAVSMGSIGVLTRVFFPALGSRITYGSTTGSTAPGQLPLRKLVEELSFYGIIQRRLFGR